MKYLWVKVDLNSPTEDILAVADTQRELAKMCGVKETSLRQSYSKAQREGKPCCYMKIENLEDDEV